jgi:hypothetical protein
MTRYVPLPPEAPRIERLRIPSGFAGTRQTAAHVARLIREGASDFYVRQKAIDILLACGVASKDYIGEIDALFRWVQRNVRYTKDPFQVEVLHAARRMLELRAGDCDDMTILLGSLVKSVGHPVRLVLTGPNARRPDIFSHIYLEAQHQGDWIPLDPTMPFAMGWSPCSPVRLVLSIKEELTDDQSSARPTATTRRTDPTARRAGARLAPRPAPRDPHGRSAAARPTGESIMEIAVPTAAPRAERVAQDDPSLRVAARTGQKISTAHRTPNLDSAQGMGSAHVEVTAPVRDWSRSRAGASDAPHAAAPSRSAAARGDGATDASRTTDAFRASNAPSAAAAPGTAAAVEKQGALTRVVRDAAGLYRHFTRFPARSFRRVSHRRLMPPVVVELGHLAAVVYRSDKWVGHPRTYIHYMEDPPRLVSDVAGRRLFLIGGSYHVTDRGIEG